MSSPVNRSPGRAAPFPFSAVVGQEAAQRALLLAAVEPALGGVLLRGDKGSAKTTLARGLAALLGPDAPFVELPVGATEDRVFGTLDVQSLLGSGEDGPGVAFRPGLLSEADGGVLYVDEVNLLPDHLVDGLLDAAASGTHRVERDGISHDHPARFVLLGSMNPEEGELRPQLLDRFGLSVEVRSPSDPGIRAEAVRRRLAHDRGEGPPERDAGSDPGPDATGDPEDPEASDAELARRLAGARPAGLPDDVLLFASELAVAVGAESLRADLVLCRAAAALAGWDGRDVTRTTDVETVAPLALGHRRRRRPFDPPTLPPDELDEALRSVTPPRDPNASAGPDDDAEDSGDNGSDRPDRTDTNGTQTDQATRPDPGPDDDPTQRDDRSTGSDAADPAHGPPPSDRPQDRNQETGPDQDEQGLPNGADEPGPDNWKNENRRHERDRADPNAAGANPGGRASTATGQRWEDLAGDQLDAEPAPVLPDRERTSRLTRPTSGPGAQGRVTGHGVPGTDGPKGIAVLPTVRAAARRRAAASGATRTAGGSDATTDGSPTADASSSPRTTRRTAGPAGREAGAAPAISGASRNADATRTTGATDVTGQDPTAQGRPVPNTGAVFAAEDLREPHRQPPTSRTVVLVVDTSGSMGTPERVAAATGAVVGLLADAYLARDQVALVAFRGDSAVEVLPPTGSVELARARLAELPTGGSTPLADGLSVGLTVAQRVAAKQSTPLLVVVTDGRATGGDQPLDQARAAARAVADAELEALVLDVEDGSGGMRLGLAAELSSLMNAHYQPLDAVSAPELESAVRHALGRT